MNCLDKIRKKQKSLDKTTHKLLDKALLSKGQLLKRKRKREGEEKLYKKPKGSQWDKTKMHAFLKSTVET